MQAIGARPLPDAFAHGIREGRHLLHAAGHVLHALRRQEKPVQKRGIAAALPGLFHIKAVLPDNLFRGAPNACGHQAQGLRLLLRLQGKHLP